MILTVTIARKPLVGSVAQNVLKYGVGGINIGACRIATTQEDKDEMLKMSRGFAGRKWGRPEIANYGYEESMPTKTVSIPASAGRFPANLLFSHLSECLYMRSKRVRGTGPRAGGSGARFNDPGNLLSRKGHEGARTDHVGYTDKEGKETIEHWDCQPNCPVAELDQQSGNRPGMSGGGAKDQVKKSGWTVQPFNRKLVQEEWLRGDSGGASRFFKQVQEE